MSNSKPATAGPIPDTGAEHLLHDIVADCVLVASDVQRLIAASHHASRSVCSTRDGYDAVSTLYRDAVARGARVRAQLCAAHPDSCLGRMAHQVGAQLEQGSQAFLAFLSLHRQGGAISGWMSRGGEVPPPPLPR